MQRRLLPSVFLITLATACQAARLEPLPLVHPAQLVSYAETLAIRGPRDSSLGIMALRFQVSDGAVVSTIDGFAHDSLFQHVEATFAAQSLRPRRVQDTRSDWRASLDYSADRVRGTLVTTSPLGTPDTVRIDGPIPPVVLDRRALLLVAPWLPVAEIHTFALRIYDADVLGTYPIRIRTGNKTRVVVPGWYLRRLPARVHRRGAADGVPGGELLPNHRLRQCCVATTGPADRAAAARSNLRACQIATTVVVTCGLTSA